MGGARCCHGDCPGEDHGGVCDDEVVLEIVIVVLRGIGEYCDCHELRMIY